MFGVFGVYDACIIDVGVCRCMWCKLWCIVIRVVLYGSPPVGFLLVVENGK